MLHRPDGELRASATPPTLNGYRLEVACPCHVVFERWVFSDDAAIDMALLARWTCRFRRTFLNSSFDPITQRDGKHLIVISRMLGSAVEEDYYRFGE
jgi:hypothetical protein